MHMIRISPSETLFLGREAERESLLSCGCFPVKTVPFPLPLAWREVDGEGRSRAWLIRLRSTTSGLELAVPLSLYMISKISLSLSPWLFSFSDTAYGTPSPAIHAGEIEERGPYLVKIEFWGFEMEAFFFLFFCVESGSCVFSISQVLSVSYREAFVYFFFSPLYFFGFRKNKVLNFFS